VLAPQYLAITGHESQPQGDREQEDDDYLGPRDRYFVPVVNRQGLPAVSAGWPGVGIGILPIVMFGSVRAVRRSGR